MNLAHANTKGFPALQAEIDYEPSMLVIRRRTYRIDPPTFITHLLGSPTKVTYDEEHIVETIDVADLVQNMTQESPPKEEGLEARNGLDERLFRIEVNSFD